MKPKMVSKFFNRYLLLAIILFVGFGPFAGSAQARTKKPKITVFGSSVASGAVAKNNRGYWYMLKELLRHRGFEVSSCSRGGDRTTRILDRFPDLLSHEADYVFIGLSLGNEGIREKDQAGRDGVFEQFRTGMLGLIKLMRENNMKPAVGLCYAHSYYRPEEYEYVKRMNVLMNSWDVPSANFLGAVDDGAGRWAKGYVNDPWHPNTEGHREMFYAIVPTLFEAMEAGIPIPKKAAGNGLLRLGNKDGVWSYLDFTSRDTIHSFALSFFVHSNHDGTLAAIEGDTIDAKIDMKEGKFLYISSNGRSTGSEIDGTDGRWHHIVISHRYAHGETLFFVDGDFIGSVRERFAPRKFTLGAKNLKEADFKELLIYRSALNGLEVKTIGQGTLLQASLEVYAPLEEHIFNRNKPVKNLAQSLSQAVYKTRKVPVKVLSRP
jgi:lysophospholipase L1-like esterase